MPCSMQLTVSKPERQSVKRMRKLAGWADNILKDILQAHIDEVTLDIARFGIAIRARILYA